MATQCDMCFQFKSPLLNPLPNQHVVICKSCAYKVTQVSGFLEYHGMTLSYDEKQMFPIEEIEHRDSTADQDIKKKAKGG